MEQNFASPQTYTVTAEDGSTQNYTVTVTAPNTAKAVTAFSLNGINGVIDEAHGLITVMLPNGTDVSALAPVIMVSPDATVSPASGVPLNFASPQTYTVTAENGDKALYLVRALLPGAGTGTVIPPHFGDISLPVTVTDHHDGSFTMGVSGAGCGNFQWFIDGVLRRTADSLTVSGYAAGTHGVTLMVAKNGVPYSVRAEFTAQ
jgi:hypothetical protein